MRLGQEITLHREDGLAIHARCVAIREDRFFDMLVLDEPPHPDHGKILEIEIVSEEIIPLNGILN